MQMRGHLLSYDTQTAQRRHRGVEGMRSEKDDMKETEKERLEHEIAEREEQIKTLQFELRDKQWSLKELRK